MSIDPPVSSQQALQLAMLETSNLRRRLPAARVREVLETFDREYARLALGLTNQIAIELQAHVNQQGNPP